MWNLLATTARLATAILAHRYDRAAAIVLAEVAEYAERRQTIEERRALLKQMDHIAESGQVFAEISQAKTQSLAK